ncbi:MAG TPA: ABC transporter ATP-binding protein [bacterium]|nr:ABC transporter ATP-binding protein [bacterium]
MAQVELRGVTKAYGATAAVRDVDLEARDGEFLTILGPSGCGKTTTLRIIAGLLDPDAGEVLIDGRPVQHLPAHRRETAMVFQSYALFPHMTVAENVGFGLRMRRVPADERRTRVADALEMVELGGLGGRYPRALSGGQQQRVAVARAVVTRPKVLLFDEPLSNLDAKLRERLRLELRALQQRLRITTVYVTHDQAEALVLSDRIVVMDHGRVVEVGAPQEVYRRPRARVTAEFLGIANLIEATIAGAVGEEYIAETAMGRLRMACPDRLASGDAVTLSFRPEDIRIGSGPVNCLTGAVRQAAYLGSVTDYVISVNDVRLRVQQPGEPAHRIGETVRLVLPEAPAVIRER